MSHGSFSEFALGLGPLLLMACGCLMLWICSWARQRSPVGRSWASSRAFAALSWLVFLIGMMATLLLTTFGFFPVFGGGALLVLGTGFIRYRQSEIRYLIWTLAESAERGIPLESAARAYANELNPAMAFNTRCLADYLDAGMPLSVALKRSGLWTPPEVRLAADVGEKTGTLGPSLRKAIEHMNELERVVGSMFSKFVYVACLVVVMITIVTFMMIKIVPVFSQMFDEFGLELPAMTEWLVSVSRVFVNYWFLATPIFLLLMFIAVAGVLSQFGYSLRGIPIIGRFFSPMDNSSILQSLAVSVRHNQPIQESLYLLAGFANTSSVHKKLDRVTKQISDGAHWCDALQRAKLITASQSALFKSAERAGNLPWALSEMADSAMRRSAQRAQAILNLLFPLLILGFGFCVLVVAVGMLMPLFYLIGALT